MLNATLVKRIEITPDLLIVRVKPDLEIPEFLPGQYVALALPGSSARPEEFPPEREVPAPDKLIKRAYSIGSPPSEKGYLEFYIAIVPTGALTSRLVMLREGDRLFCAPKITGTFTLEPVPAEKNLVFVATGTGLAPYMAMLRAPGILSEGRKVSLLHGVRYQRDLAYRDEIAALQEQHPGLSYHAYVSREDARPGVFQRGYVQQAFEKGDVATDASADHVFVCGNPAMIDDVEKLLTARGYSVHSKKLPHGSLHLEKYW